VNTNINLKKIIQIKNIYIEIIIFADRIHSNKLSNGKKKSLDHKKKKIFCYVNI